MCIRDSASALALMVMPREACRNLQTLAEQGFLGACGFYEAIDYTPTRVPRGKNHAVVRAFMAHHQGTVSYTHLRAHETVLDLVCRLLLDNKKK